MAAVMLKQYSSAYSMPFVGRAKELAEISARLVNPECRLLTLTGLGGSGKTRLAIEAAASVAEHFPHGAVFVGLQPLTRSDLLVPAIAQAIGLAFYGEGAPQDQLLDYLRDKTLLLILDNFEHVLDAAALVGMVLTSAMGVTVLATSREALSLQEEWLYPLKGMAAPSSVYSTPLEEYEAVQLFLSHARRVQPQFDLPSAREAVFRICALTAGLPLAIELAASWLKGLGAAQIADEMRRNIDFLSTTMRNVEDRHRSMRTVFDYSWALLPEDQRLIFVRLCVFAGGFTSQAAEQVAGASFASLAALVEKSLVQIEPSGRFGMHELLRQYGMEQLETYRQTEAAYAQHSHYFAQLMLVHEAELKQPQQLDTIQAIGRDFDNIRLAWEWSAKNQHLAQLHIMLNGLYLFGFVGSRYHETIALFQDALDRAAIDAPLRGRLIARRWGYLHWWYQEDYQQALARVEQALAIAVLEHNQFEIAFCQLTISYVMGGMLRYADALPHLETSQALFEALDEPYYVCWTLHRLGYMYSNLNEVDKGDAYTERSLVLARATHNRIALVICLYNLGSGYILKCDYLTGRHYCQEALQIATESGHQGQISLSLSLLALCAFCQGDYNTCQTYAKQSQAITEELNRFLFHAYNLSLLILLACLREDYGEAVRLGEVAKRHISNRFGFQLLYWARATLACGLSNPAEARLCIQTMLEQEITAINPGPAIWIVPSAAYALAETHPEQALELLAWVFSYPDSALNWAREWPLIGRLQAQLQTTLDRDTYQQHWHQGTTRTLGSITHFLDRAFGAASDAGAAAAQHSPLTAREHEILHLIATGLSNPQIAAQLIIGVGTVKTHTLSIYRKLEVANRSQAIVRAQQLGLLPA